MTADEEMREEYERILTKASMEIAAANVRHLKKKENEIEGRSTEIEKAIDAQNNENRGTSSCRKGRVIDRGIA